MDIGLLQANVTKVSGIELRMTRALQRFSITPRDLLLSSIIHGGLDKDKPLLRIELPCGEVVSYQTKDDLPDGTVICPCGNPGHYMVDFEWLEE